MKNNLCKSGKKFASRAFQFLKEVEKIEFAIHPLLRSGTGMRWMCVQKKRIDQGQENLFVDVAIVCQKPGFAEKVPAKRMRVGYVTKPGTAVADVGKSYLGPAMQESVNGCIKERILIGRRKAAIQVVEPIFKETQPPAISVSLTQDFQREGLREQVFLHNRRREGIGYGCPEPAGYQRLRHQ